MDRRTADFILNLIREEEAKSEVLRANSGHEVTSSREAAEEQTFNREQVQEQEQVSS
jgi:hypothetical protein